MGGESRESESPRAGNRLRLLGAGRKARSPPPLPRETASRGNPLPPPPRLLLPLWKERGATRSRSRSAARLREPPPAPSPRGEVLLGELHRSQGGAQGAGGARAPDSQRSQLRHRVGAFCPSQGPSSSCGSPAVSYGKTASLPGGPIRASPRLVEKLQPWLGRKKKQGAHQERVSLEGKGARGVGALSAGFA